MTPVVLVHRKIEKAPNARHLASLQCADTGVHVCPLFCLNVRVLVQELNELPHQEVPKHGMSQL